MGSEEEQPTWLALSLYYAALHAAHGTIALERSRWAEGKENSANTALIDSSPN